VVDVSDGRTVERLSLEAGVLTLALARSAKRNAMNLAMARELHALLDDADEARALVLTGDARTFSAGADLVEGGGADAEGINWFATTDRLVALEIPTIAAIEGYCLGGGLELALCCDLRIAGRSATFGTPEVVHGVFPAGGATQRLPRVVGPARAKELMLVGERIPADTALSWGLVNRVVDDGTALAAAQALAATLASRAEAAVHAIKRLADQALDTPLAEGLAAERAALHDVLHSEAAASGAQAFRDRRRGTGG
jgi:enoyl-CoA hydratase